jgi:hypothetical protein
MSNYVNTNTNGVADWIPFKTQYVDRARDRASASFQANLDISFGLGE